jgi:hypothetical protein
MQHLTFGEYGSREHIPRHQTARAGKIVLKIIEMSVKIDVGELILHAAIRL